MADVLRPTEVRVSIPDTFRIAAEMDEVVQVNDTATVEVTLSREAVSRPGRARAAEVGIAHSTNLIIQVISTTNFVMAGSSDRVEVPIPRAGRPQPYYFDVKGAHPGDGEIWIVIRQHQMGICRLELRPRVVERAALARAPLRAAGEATEAAPLTEPLNQLLVIERRVGNSVSYQFELESAAIGDSRLFHSKPLQAAREKYIRDLHEGIESRYRSAVDAASKKVDAEAFERELRAYGAKLFDDLFPCELQELLWEHRSLLGGIRVVSNEPFIPWEVVHLKRPGGPMRLDEPPQFMGQLRLVRWLHDAATRPPATLRVRREQARYVIPNYAAAAMKLPATLAERVFMEKRFKATPVRPTLQDVQALLAKPGAFDLLHVACPDFLRAATVEQYADLRGAAVQPIVVFNACPPGRIGQELASMGGFAQAFLKRGAGAFVGALWHVGDQPSFTFIGALYDALLKGQTLTDATATARTAARQAGDATWLAYTVYGHPHAKLRFE